ncbi:MAG: VWA domain-containing protein [Actinomycetota bacterium]|nr:VWA domain-containing protein [Actinomycetota bacterium]
MTRPRLFATAVVAALGAVLPLSALSVPAALGAADDALTVVSTEVGAYPDVRLVVAAPASLGDQTLGPAAFRVTENGESRTVRVDPLPADQLEVALVIDTSGSMSGPPLAAAKSAAQSFLSQLPATVPVSVTGFGASPTVVASRSSNRPAQLAAVNGLTAGGQTALYDAVRTGLDQLPGTSTRRVVVLLSDGGDTTSAATLDATAGALASAKIPLFVVELRTAESNSAALTRLTSASGGRVVPASDPTALAGAFDSIAKQLVRQYAVTYRSDARGGTDVGVVLEAQGLRATARARIELPAAPAAVPAPAAERATSDRRIDSWPLVAGAVLCGLGGLGLLLVLLVLRPPRARGLAVPRRANALAGAAARAEAVGESVLRSRGGVRSIGTALEAAGLDIRPGELLLGMAGATVSALVLGWLLVGPIVGLVLAVLVFLGVRLGLDALARRRRNQFRDQLAEALQIMAGSLRAGHGLAHSIETVGREAESPAAEEFRRVTVETRLGRDFVQSLEALAARMRSEDFQWVAQAIEIQRDVGGDLAAILDTVASTIHDRVRVRRQVSALSAEGRLSAMVLMALPFGLALVMSATNRTYLSPLFHSRTGLILVAVGLGLLTVGGLWLRKIVKPIF